MTYYEDLEVPQGSYYKFQIQMYSENGSRKDLSNVVAARGKINYSYQAKDSDAVDFFINVDAPPQNGILDCSLTDTQTDSLERRRYLYDIELDYITPHGVKYTDRILEGKIIVSKTVNFS